MAKELEGGRIPDHRQKILGSKIREKLVPKIQTDQELTIKSVEQLQNTIQRISKILEGQREDSDKVKLMTQVDIEELINHVKKEFLDSPYPIEYRANKIPQVKVESHKLSYCLKELFANAIESYEKDLNSNDWGVEVSCIHQEDHKLVITVKDQGCGIGTEVLPKIFRSGFTTKKEHLGVGLHESYNAIHSMGGTLAVQSTSKKGTTFELIIPYEKTND